MLILSAYFKDLITSFKATVNKNKIICVSLAKGLLLGLNEVAVGDKVISVLTDSC